VKQAITGTEPGGPYSPGIVAEGRFVFVSGQSAMVGRQRQVGTIADETRLTLENVGQVLSAAGATFADVVRCTVYLADVLDFDAMNAVYQEFFQDPRPSRTTIGCQLRLERKVEIDCVAVLPSS
jgi:2-iminobutanoate/2-iminopropanoate deaminase